MITTLDRMALQALLADPAVEVVLVEALGAIYFEDAHLPGAVNIPHDRVDELAPVLIPDRGTVVVVYCSDASCQNSASTSRRLVELGYRHVFEYVGGKQDWIEAGLPVERGEG